MLRNQMAVPPFASAQHILGALNVNGIAGVGLLLASVHMGHGRSMNHRVRTNAFPNAHRLFCIAYVQRRISPPLPAISKPILSPTTGMHTSPGCRAKQLTTNFCPSGQQPVIKRCMPFKIIRTRVQRGQCLVLGGSQAFGLSQAGPGQP